MDPFFKAVSFGSDPAEEAPWTCFPTAPEPRDEGEGGDGAQSAPRRKTLHITFASDVTDPSENRTSQSRAVKRRTTLPASLFKSTGTLSQPACKVVMRTRHGSIAPAPHPPTTGRRMSRAHGASPPNTTGDAPSPPMSIRRMSCAGAPPRRMSAAFNSGPGGQPVETNATPAARRMSLAYSAWRGGEALAGSPRKASAGRGGTLGQKSREGSTASSLVSGPNSSRNSIPTADQRRASQKEADTPSSGAVAASERRMSVVSRNPASGHSGERQSSASPKGERRASVIIKNSLPGSPGHKPAEKGESAYRRRRPSRTLQATEERRDSNTVTSPQSRTAGNNHPVGGVLTPTSDSGYEGGFSVSPPARKASIATNGALSPTLPHSPPLSPSRRSGCSASPVHVGAPHRQGSFSRTALASIGHQHGEGSFASSPSASFDGSFRVIGMPSSPTHAGNMSFRRSSLAHGNPASRVDHQTQPQSDGSNFSNMHNQDPSLETNEPPSQPDSTPQNRRSTVSLSLNPKGSSSFRRHRPYSPQSSSAAGDGAAGSPVGAFSPTFPQGSQPNYNGNGSNPNTPRSSGWFTPAPTDAAREALVKERRLSIERMQTELVRETFEKNEEHRERVRQAASARSGKRLLRAELEDQAKKWAALLFAAQSAAALARALQVHRASGILSFLFLPACKRWLGVRSARRRREALLQERRSLMTEPTVSSLKKIKFFDCWPVHALREIVGSMTPYCMQSGEFVCMEGEPGDRMFVLDNGEVEIRVMSEAEKDKSRALGVFITKMSSGYFGEYSIICREKRFASVRCVTDTDLWTISASVVSSVLPSLPIEIRERLQAETARRRQDNLRKLHPLTAALLSSSSPIFSMFTDAQLAKLVPLLTPVVARSPTHLYKENDSADSLLYVATGSVKLTRHVPPNTTAVRERIVEAGQCIGEDEILFGERRGWTAETLGAADLWSVQKNTLTDFLLTYPVLYYEAKERFAHVRASLTLPCAEAYWMSDGVLSTHLPAKFLKRIPSLLKPKVSGRGDQVVAAGQPFQGVIFVAKGTLKDEKSGTIFPPGSTIGAELWITFQQRWEVALTAVERVDCWTLPALKAYEELDQHFKEKFTVLTAEATQSALREQYLQPYQPPDAYKELLRAKPAALQAQHGGSGTNHLTVPSYGRLPRNGSGVALGKRRGSNASSRLSTKGSMYSLLASQRGTQSPKASFRRQKPQDESKSPESLPDRQRSTDAAHIEGNLRFPRTESSMDSSTGAYAPLVTSLLS
ncbi:hypothetical protein DIPPA_25229 [Diplonema papillatum]|nr:hypothetical protein DIPPA_25229 [Diplonema papillatum]